MRLEVFRATYSPGVRGRLGSRFLRSARRAEARQALPGSEAPSPLVFTMGGKAFPGL
jgi:hypothetical protein